MAIAVAITFSQLAPAQTPPVESGKFDANSAWNYLTEQVAFGPRKPGTDAHRSCRDFIMHEMEKSCVNVRLQPFSHEWSSTHETIKMWNVIGEQDYADAKVRIALFAHWDTRPTADNESTPERVQMPIPGANDGASEVAVLLELMRAMKDRHPGVGILFVMLDGEDLGPGEDEMYLGASAFARELPTPKPDYGILLDMIGGKNLRVTEELNSVRYAPRLERLFYAHAARIGLGKTFPSIAGDYIGDDHGPINEAHLPTIDLIDLVGYPDWHKLSDTPDKCSPESLGKVGTMLESWINSPDALAAAGKS